VHTTQAPEATAGVFSENMAMHTISTVSAHTATEYSFANPSRRDFVSRMAAMMPAIRGISISCEVTFAPMEKYGGALINT